MPTPGHLRTVHQAARSLGLNDAQYRTILWNAAKVRSSKALSNAGIEDVMAVMEDMGFDRHPGGKTYWRDKVLRRGGGENAREVWKIGALAAEAGLDVCGFCRRMSGGRTDVAEELDSRERYNVIEALKAIVARADDRKAAAGGSPTAGVKEDADGSLLPF